jgi:hypothetical protein
VWDGFTFRQQPDAISGALARARVGTTMRDERIQQKAAAKPVQSLVERLSDCAVFPDPDQLKRFP